MRRLLVLLATVTAAVVLGAGPASAHNVLVDSTPKDGATLDAGPAEVVLTFDLPVRAGDQFDSIVVIGPAGDHWEDGKAAVDGRSVRAPVRTLGPAGVYTISYQILSDDGHPVRSEVHFTLAKAGGGTPTPGTTTVTKAEQGGVPVWVWIGGAVLLLGAGVVLALRGGGERR